LADDENISIAGIVNQKKIGDSIKVKYFRDKTETEVEVMLEKKTN
jgi:S1-C subfamily serine protease